MRVTVIMLSVLMLFSCAGSKSGKSGPYKITISEGGGITGQRLGFHMDDTGLVQKWTQMPGQEEQIEWEKSGNSKKIYKFKKTIESSLTDINIDQSSNMSRLLTIQQQDTTRQWRFPATLTSQEIPLVLTSLYQDIYEYCSGL